MMVLQTLVLGVLSASHALPRRQVLAASLALGAAPAIPTTFQAELPRMVFDQIAAGRPAVLPNWLPPADVAALCADARALHKDGCFLQDGLAAYAPSRPSRSDAPAERSAKRAAASSRGALSREVLPAYIPSARRAGPWADATLGNAAARLRFASRIEALRIALADGLDRAALGSTHVGDAPAPPPDRPRSLARLASELTEVSYTRFAPGAALRRHVDERHEELKGDGGWARPTRRSVSWLVYLNTVWDPAVDGGVLRTFPRALPPGSPVGAHGGELQVGWLRATAADPVERPVFLDSSRAGGGSGNCALFTVRNGPRGSARVLLSRDFWAQPLLYQSAALLINVLLIDNPGAAGRFQFVEAPRSAATEWLGAMARKDAGEGVCDVAPVGGTLVLFDSVALPHEVLPTIGRERWACSGWLHEPQLRRSRPT